MRWLAIVGALEGVVMAMAEREPDDEVCAERAVAGVLGLARAPGARPLGEQAPWRRSAGPALYPDGPPTA